MNLKEAYEKMREGKKVRRKGRSMCCVYDSKENKIYTGDGLAVTGIAFEAALADDWEIVEEKKKYWTPKEKEKYFYIEDCMGVSDDRNVQAPIDYCRFNIGNFFKTKIEAEHMLEKLKVIHELQKFAYENNEGEIDWKNFNQCKYYLVYDTKDEDLYVDYSIQCESEPFNIYFTSFDIAKKAIEAVGEDRIKKYYFNVEEA